MENICYIVNDDDDDDDNGCGGGCGGGGGGCGCGHNSPNQYLIYHSSLSNRKEHKYWTI